MPAQLLPVTGKRALLRTQQVSESEPPASVSVQGRQVSVWQLTQVPQVSATGPVPVPQVSATEPEPVLQVSESVLPPVSRLHSLHWQVY